MTQQVRKGYRNHRKATWAFVIALAALIAAVVIPIASGASDKNYTLSSRAAARPRLPQKQRVRGTRRSVLERRPTPRR